MLFHTRPGHAPLWQKSPASYIGTCVFASLLAGCVLHSGCPPYLRWQEAAERCVLPWRGAQFGRGSRLVSDDAFAVRMCMAFIAAYLSCMRSLGTLHWSFNSPLTAEKQLAQTVSAKGRLARGKTSFKKKKTKKPKTNKR